METMRTIRLKRKTALQLCEIGKLKQTSRFYDSWAFVSICSGVPGIICAFGYLDLWPAAMISLAIIIGFVFAVGQDKKTWAEIQRLEKELGLTGERTSKSLKSMEEDGEIEIEETVWLNQDN